MHCLLSHECCFVSSYIWIELAIYLQKNWIWAFGRIYFTGKIQTNITSALNNEFIIWKIFPKLLGKQ